MAPVKHGMCGTRTYGIWAGILTRCTNPRTKAYENYGGRGIYVCGSWQKFENFLFDMGLAPEGASIERINNDGPYSPENCKWSNPSAQCNNKRNNIRITFDGETLTAAQWAAKIGIPRTTIVRRVRSGKPPEQILSKEFLPRGFLNCEPPIAAIRRAMTHCRRGHPLSGGNLYEATPGKRTCKTCRDATKRKFNVKARTERHARGLKNKGRWAHLPPPISS